MVRFSARVIASTPGRRAPAECEHLALYRRGIVPAAGGGDAPELVDELGQVTQPDRCVDGGTDVVRPGVVEVVAHLDDQLPVEFTGGTCLG